MKTITPTINAPSQFFLARSACPSIIAAFAATLMAFCSVQTRADTIALSFNGGSVKQSGALSLTAGWAFSLNEPLLLTQLGLWDRFNNGLVESHVVTVWTSTGSQLAQATIPAGTSSTLADGFRFVSIMNSIVLPAGNYTIGAFYETPNSPDLFAIDAITVSTASGITYAGGREGFGNAFPAGDIDDVPNSYFGPNFQFTAPTSVPDVASAWTLLLVGLAATSGLNILIRRSV